MPDNFPYLLGVDFGLKKVGLAIATIRLASPYKTMKYKSMDSLISQIALICKEENIQKIVVGISEGDMAEKTRRFIQKLKDKVIIQVVEFDETLSTQDAQRLSFEAGIKRSKRKNLEDAMAATVMLQNYIDSSKLT